MSPNMLLFYKPLSEVGHAPAEQLRSVPPVPLEGAAPRREAAQSPAWRKVSSVKRESVGDICEL